MFSVQLLCIYKFASVVMMAVAILVTYFTLGYSAWFQGCRWLRFSTSCGPYSPIFRQTTSHCHVVFVDDMLLVLRVVATDPLQGSINHVLCETIGRYFQHAGHPFSEHQKTFSLH